MTPSKIKFRQEFQKTIIRNLSIANCKFIVNGRL